MGRALFLILYGVVAVFAAALIACVWFWHQMRRAPQRIVSAVRGNRTAGVIAALVLVGVPTLYSIFPGLATSRQDRADRMLVMGGWVVVALVAAVATASREAEQETVAYETYQVTVRVALQAMLDPRASGIPPNYVPAVYRFAESQQRLFPWYPDRIDDSSDYRVFPLGAGATGRAFQQDATVVVVGDAVSNEEYDLTDAQQHAFAQYSAVAATPIRGLDDRPFGCLTAISPANDEFFASEDGDEDPVSVELLERLADRIGTILAPPRGSLPR